MEQPAEKISILDKISSIAADGDKTEILKKLRELKEKTREVEERLPMISYKIEDEQSQLKYFIMTYY